MRFPNSAVNCAESCSAIFWKMQDHTCFVQVRPLALEQTFCRFGALSKPYKNLLHEITRLFSRQFLRKS